MATKKALRKKCLSKWSGPESGLAAAVRPVFAIPCLSGKKQGLLTKKAVFFGFCRCPIIKRAVGETLSQNIQIP